MGRGGRGGKRWEEVGRGGKRWGEVGRGERGKEGGEKINSLRI